MDEFRKEAWIWVKRAWLQACKRMVYRLRLGSFQRQAWRGRQ